MLKLVDGSLGNVPVRPDTGLGGFTVASENPVYIQGDYNSNTGDPFWGNPPPAWWRTSTTRAACSSTLTPSTAAVAIGLV